MQKQKLKIKYLRLLRGLTQYELGQMCQIHQPDISKYENGEKKMGGKTKMKIASSLGVELGDLFED